MTLPARSRLIVPTRPVSPTDEIPFSVCEGAGQFERLYAAYQTPILNYVYRLVGDPAVAEELTQEAFARAWRARSKLLAIENPRAWLYRIATNAARDHLRRRALLTWLPLLGNETRLAEQGIEDANLEAERMRRALLRLPPDYRVPLVLYTCQEFSVTEIAESLGLTPDAVKQRLVRARQKLREAYR
jgi:RNA polymerase sigma-70 factor (ECF subfamily)